MHEGFYRHPVPNGTSGISPGDRLLPTFRPQRDCCAIAPKKTGEQREVPISLYFFPGDRFASSERTANAKLATEQPNAA
jgi:hypothetical protein